MKHDPPLEAYPFDVSEEGFHINRFEAEVVAWEIGAAALTDPDLVPETIQNLGSELDEKLKTDRAHRISIDLSRIGALEEYYRSLTIGMTAQGISSSRYRRYVTKLEEHRKRLFPEDPSLDIAE